MKKCKTNLKNARDSIFQSNILISYKNTLKNTFFEKCFQDLANKLGLKIRDFLFPLFVAITGNAISISVIESTAILGIDITRSRLRQAIAILGGVSKKAAKNLEKEFKALG